MNGIKSVLVGGVMMGGGGGGGLWCSGGRQCLFVVAGSRG